MSHHPPSRRARSVGACLLACFIAGSALLLPSCATWDGHFDVLGYTTRPNYDTCYKTIRVPIFKNRSFWTATPVPGMEMDLTRAVIREIEQKTPYKVVQGDADTELKGTITFFGKAILNYTQFNTVREAQTTMIVELVWRDLRTGKILSTAPRRHGDPFALDPRQPLLASPDSLLPPGSKPGNFSAVPLADASAVVGEGEDEILDPVTKVKVKPAVIRSVAEFRPELGESITTAMQKNMDRMAVQIVSAMEKSW